MATRIIDGVRVTLTQKEVDNINVERAGRPPEPKPAPTLEDIIGLLISKGLLTQAEIDAAIKG